MDSQPPLGGCVLKHIYYLLYKNKKAMPAAFRRLCVETNIKEQIDEANKASRL